MKGNKLVQLGFISFSFQGCTQTDSAVLIQKSVTFCGHLNGLLQYRCTEEDIKLKEASGRFNENTLHWFKHI